MQRRLFVLIFSLIPALCFASRTPTQAWEVVLSKIADSLVGPVAYFIAIMVIFSCGMAMAFVDLQSGGKRFVQSACGIAVAVFAAKIVTGFLGFSGALI